MSQRTNDPTEQADDSDANEVTRSGFVFVVSLAVSIAMATLWGANEFGPLLPPPKSTLIVYWFGAIFGYSPVWGPRLLRGLRDRGYLGWAYKKETPAGAS